MIRLDVKRTAKKWDCQMAASCVLRESFVMNHYKRSDKNCSYRMLRLQRVQYTGENVEMQAVFMEMTETLKFSGFGHSHSRRV